MLLCVTPGLRGKGCISWWVWEKGGCSVPSPELLWAASQQQRLWDGLLSPPGMPAGAEPMSQQTFTTVALELAIRNPQQ